MLQLRADQERASGPPYAPVNAVLGGRPSVAVDVPICAVFIAIYLSFAVFNSTLFRLNLRRGHKFFISMVFTGFSMARVATCTLRIAWATRLDNVSLGIAAMIFTNVGVLALFVINLILAQRILRARKPQIGWNPIVKAILTAIYCLVFVALVLVIVFTVLSFYTRDMELLVASRDIQLASATYLLTVTVLPFLVLATAYFPDRTTTSASMPETQTFGQGSVGIKVLILLTLTTLMALEEGYKVGTSWVLTPHPASQPPWYDSKACFYAFGFMLEVLYLGVASATRVDQKFWVPDGSSLRRTYVRSEKEGFQDVEDGPMS